MPAAGQVCRGIGDEDAITEVLAGVRLGKVCVKEGGLAVAVVPTHPGASTCTAR